MGAGPGLLLSSSKLRAQTVQYKQSLCKCLLTKKGLCSCFTWGTWPPPHKKYSLVSTWGSTGYTLIRGLTDTCPALQRSPITSTRTCSLVVRPLATSTTWNPVRPATGMKNKPATHITAILKPNSQGEQSNMMSPSPAHTVAIFPWTSLPQDYTIPIFPPPNPTTHKP